MRRRTEVVQVRLTVEEKKRLLRRATKLGLSVSDYIRSSTGARMPANIIMDTYSQDGDEGSE